MRSLFATMLAGLALMFTVTAVASADDFPLPGPVPVPGPIVCALALEEPPLPPGELPGLEDPVAAETDAWGCPPRVRQAATADFGPMADAKVAVASVKTEGSTTSDANGQPQVRLNVTVTGKGANRATGANLRYEVTVTVPAPPNGQPKVTTKALDLPVTFTQTDGSLGGTNVITFAPAELPVGAKVVVKLTGGTVSVTAGNLGQLATVDAETLPEFTRQR